MIYCGQTCKKVTIWSYFFLSIQLGSIKYAGRVMQPSPVSTAQVFVNTKTISPVSESLSSDLPLCVSGTISCLVSRNLATLIISVIRCLSFLASLQDFVLLLFYKVKMTTAHPHLDTWVVSHLAPWTLSKTSVLGPRCFDRLEPWKSADNTKGPLTSLPQQQGKFSSSSETLRIPCPFISWCFLLSFHSNRCAVISLWYLTMNDVENNFIKELATCLSLFIQVYFLKSGFVIELQFLLYLEY